MRIRHLLCKWFHLTPNEDVPEEIPESGFWLPDNSWDDLWRYRDLRPVFPRITLSPVWKTDLEPWFRQGLLFTLLKMTHETDPEKLRMLQERAKLLHEWIETPRLAEAHTQAALSNAYGSGKPDRMDEAMKRFNAMKV